MMPIPVAMMSHDEESHVALNFQVSRPKMCQGGIDDDVVFT